MTADPTNNRRSLLAVVLPLALLGLAGCPDDDTAPGGSINVKAQHLSVGAHHACIVSDGGEVWCWGMNIEGCLGDGTTTSPQSIPVRAPVPATVTQVAAGGRHTCALTSKGKVYCFGDNGDGQLGDGTTTSRSSPVEVAGLSGVVQIAAGTAFSCALDSQGKVWCWGANNIAQLGIGVAKSQPLPRQVDLANIQIAHVEAGSMSACALTSGGDAYCWGKTSPDLGNQVYLAPAAMTFATPAQELALGSDFWCARGANGGVRCWGKNSAGQLGNGTMTDFTGTPGDVLLPGPARSVSTCPAAVDMMGIGMYDTFACAALEDGRAMCWGVNGAGQLGDGTTENRATPVSVQGLTGVAEVGVGGTDILDNTEAFACAITSSGEAWCWGENSSGQLGDGTTAPSLAPVRVELP